MTNQTTPSKILIIRLSSIGDILLATPLIRILRKKFPDAQIDFLTKSRFAELLQTNPYLNQVFQFDDTGGFRELKRIKKLIKKTNYDWFVNIHNNLRTVYLSSFNPISHKFKLNKRGIRRLFLVKFKWNFYRNTTPAHQRYIEPLNSFGVVDDGNGLFQIGAGVHKDVVDADAAGDDGNRAVAAAVIMQARAAPGDDHVDLACLANQFADCVPVRRANELNGVRGHALARLLVCQGSPAGRGPGLINYLTHEINAGSATK